MRHVMLALMVLGLSAGSAQARSHHRGYHGHHRTAGIGCLRPKTRAMIAQLTHRIGPIQITSTCGGRHVAHSQHYLGNAIDFHPLRVSNAQAVRVLHSMPIVGGIGTYGGGHIHADVGERHMSWHSRGRTRFAGRHRHHYASYRRHFVPAYYRPYWG